MYVLTLKVGELLIFGFCVIVFIDLFTDWGKSPSVFFLIFYCFFLYVLYYNTCTYDSCNKVFKTTIVSVYSLLPKDKKNS